MTSTPSGPIESATRRGSTVIRTLLLTDFVASTRLVETLGDQQAAGIFARHDRLARDLLGRHHGREIDKTDGFLFLFERPVDAVRYALTYHDALLGLSAECGVPLKARVGIHLGEVVLLENTPGDVERGAKPIEVEGLAKPTAARVMSLAEGGQTLLTRAAYEMGKRASVGVADLAEGLEWVQHGVYQLKGVDDLVPIFEVGRVGRAPLAAPRDSEKVRRIDRKKKSALARGVQFGLLAGLVFATTALFMREQPREAEAPVEQAAADAAPAGEPTTTTTRAAPADTPGASDAPAAAACVSLRILSVPPGATVFRGAKRMGQTPVIVSLPPAASEFVLLYALAGHEDIGMTCRIDDGAVAVGEAVCAAKLTAAPDPPPAIAAADPAPETASTSTSAEEVARRPVIPIIE